MNRPINYEFTQIRGEPVQGHTPTKGKGLSSSVHKATFWIKLKSQDALGPHQSSTSKVDQSVIEIFKAKREAIYEGMANKEYFGWNAVDQTVNRLSDKCSSLISNADVSVFFSYLNQSQNLKDKNITFNPNGLFQLDKPNKPSEELKSVQPGERTFYPFVFPKKNNLSYDHIVLIAVDSVNKQILYYDSQGLSSDDPTRNKVFKEDTGFNMRDDLEKLSRDLFGNQGTIVENREPVQKDPFNCGVFVMNALQKLSDPEKSFEDFLIEGMDKDITVVRKELGTGFMNYLTQGEDRDSF